MDCSEGSERHAQLADGELVPDKEKEIWTEGQPSAFHKWVEGECNRDGVVPGQSVLKPQSLTVGLLATFRKCHPKFHWDPSNAPKRALTKPCEGVSNNGRDNANSDYILHVRDIIGDAPNPQYEVQDLLGSGTFGQVVRCRSLSTGEDVAVKIVKNKPAYHNQSMMEVRIHEVMTKRCGDVVRKYFVCLQQHFVWRGHLCLVFELLSVNLYELLKQNNFRGFSINLIRVFVKHMLWGLAELHRASIIHCDLKLENILLQNLNSTVLKIIDFGSACFESNAIYSYFQSRFYRSPEVLLCHPYSCLIDVWSLGCIAGELFLGLPLFPGASELDQIRRIVDLLGLPPRHMLERSKRASRFFNFDPCPHVKTPEQFNKEYGTDEKPSKKYFTFGSLQDLVSVSFRKDMTEEEERKELAERQLFVHFLGGLLEIDPAKRWTPEQALAHPFITGAPFCGTFEPPRVTPPRFYASTLHTPSLRSSGGSTEELRPVHFSWSNLQALRRAYDIDLQSVRSHSSHHMMDAFQAAWSVHQQHHPDLHSPKTQLQDMDPHQQEETQYYTQQQPQHSPTRSSHQGSPHQNFPQSGSYAEGTTRRRHSTVPPATRLFYLSPQTPHLESEHGRTALALSEGDFASGQGEVEGGPDGTGPEVDPGSLGQEEIKETLQQLQMFLHYQNTQGSQASGGGPSSGSRKNSRGSVPMFPPQQQPHQHSQQQQQQQGGPARRNSYDYYTSQSPRQRHSFVGYLPRGEGDGSSDYLSVPGVVGVSAGIGSLRRNSYDAHVSARDTHGQPPLLSPSHGRRRGSRTEVGQDGVNPQRELSWHPQDSEDTYGPPPVRRSSYDPGWSHHSSVPPEMDGLTQAHRQSLPRSTSRDEVPGNFGVSGPHHHHQYQRGNSNDPHYEISHGHGHQRQAYYGQHPPPHHHGHPHHYSNHPQHYSPHRQAKGGFEPDDREYGGNGSYHPPMPVRKHASQPVLPTGGGPSGHSGQGGPLNQWGENPAVQHPSMQQVYGGGHFGGQRAHAGSPSGLGARGEGISAGRGPRGGPMSWRWPAQQGSPEASPSSSHRVPASPSSPPRIPQSGGNYSPYGSPYGWSGQGPNYGPGSYQQSRSHQPSPKSHHSYQRRSGSLDYTAFSSVSVQEDRENGVCEHEITHQSGPPLPTYGRERDLESRSDRRSTEAESRSNPEFANHDQRAPEDDNTNSRSDNPRSNSLDNLPRSSNQLPPLGMAGYHQAQEQGPPMPPSPGHSRFYQGGRRMSRGPLLSTGPMTAVDERHEDPAAGAPSGV